MKTKDKKVKFGLLTKLLLSLILPMVLIMVLIGFRIGVRTEETVKKLDADYLTAEAGQAAAQVHAYFQKYVGITEMAASENDIADGISKWDGTFNNSQNQEQLWEVLKEIAGSDESVVYAWLCNLDRKEFIQSDDTYETQETFDVTSRKWYQPVVDSKETSVTGVYENVSTKDLIMTVAAPVFVKGELKGILGIDVLLETLTSELESVQVGENGYVTVFDTEDTIIYHPEKELVMSGLSESGYSENILKMVEEKKNINGLSFEQKGTGFVGAGSYLEQEGYFVLGVMPEEEYQSYIKEVMGSLIFWLLMAIVILSGIIILFSTKITGSVKKLSKAAAKIADGDLEVKTDVVTSDEVGVLAKDIDAITDRLKEYILYIDEITEVLQQIGKGNFVFVLKQEYKGEFLKVKKALLEVRDTISDTLRAVVVAADEVASGADQVSLGAQSQAQGATEQASSVQELAATLEDISQQIDANTEMILHTGQEIEFVSESVAEGEQRMQSMLRAMDGISENSMKVEKIIKSIEDIAFQTNILALNAAVEAARAGEAGKGFAVVADEVRNLAGKTAEASKTTAELIEKALEAVENGKVIADKTAESFEQVYEKIGGISEEAKGIIDNSKRQDETVKQTALGVEQISSVVQTNSATAEESAAASEELSGQAQLLQELVDKFHLPKK